MRRGRRERGGRGGNWTVRMTKLFIFPNMYWRVVRLFASRRICPDVAPRISGSWSRWCSTTCRLTVTEKWRAESLPCLVPELPRVVKRVVPGPSMIRQRILKTHDIVETRSTPSWRPFGCCLPTKANHVIGLNVGSPFPNHEGWSRSAASSWVRVSSAFTAPADQEKRHVAHVCAEGWICERTV